MILAMALQRRYRSDVRVFRELDSFLRLLLLGVSVLNKAGTALFAGGVTVKFCDVVPLCAVLAAGCFATPENLKVIQPEYHICVRVVRARDSFLWLLLLALRLLWLLHFADPGFTCTVCGCCVVVCPCVGAEFKGAPTAISQRCPGCPCAGFIPCVAPNTVLGFVCRMFELPTCVFVVSFANPNLTNSDVGVFSCGSNSFLQEVKTKEVTTIELISIFGFMMWYF